MDCQGKIINWKDAEGYGFILPNDGSAQVFVHIRAFTKRSRRPVMNENVSYDIATDEQGRTRASRVLFEGEAPPKTSPLGRGMLTSILSIFFLIALSGMTLLGMLPVIVIALYSIASVVTYVTYALDKSAAKNNRWRTPENTLHFLSLMGGWPGALLAQNILRHKTSKSSFLITFWVTTILNCCALAWLLTTQGSEFLHSMLFDTLWVQ